MSRGNGSAIMEMYFGKWANFYVSLMDINLMGNIQGDSLFTTNVVYGI
jgi:hypothetical protein